MKRNVLTNYENFILLFVFHIATDCQCIVIAVNIVQWYSILRIVGRTQAKHNGVTQAIRKKSSRYITFTIAVHILSPLLPKMVKVQLHYLVWSASVFMAFVRVYSFMFSSAYHKSGGQFRCHLNRVPNRIDLGSILRRWDGKIPTVLLLPWIVYRPYYLLFRVRLQRIRIRAISWMHSTNWTISS